MKLCTFLAIVIAFSFSSCKSGSGEHTIAMRLAKGDSFTITSNTKMKYDMEVMGMKQQFTMDNSSETDFDVLDSTASGVEMVMTIKNQSMKMDMGKDMPAQNTAQTDSMARAWIGKKIHFKVKDGKVSDIRGWENLTEGSDSAVNAFTKNLMTEETFSQMSGMMFDIYPPNPVRKGESWTKKSKLSMAGMPVSITTKYTLKEIKDGLAFITIDGNFDSEETELAMLPGLKMKFSGPSKGTTTLRVSDGYMNESEYDFDIKADAEMAGQKLLMNMSGTVTSKGK